MGRLPVRPFPGQRSWRRARVTSLCTRSCLTRPWRAAGGSRSSWLATIPRLCKTANLCTRETGAANGWVSRVRALVLAGRPNRWARPGAQRGSAWAPRRPGTRGGFRLGRCARPGAGRRRETERPPATGCARPRRLLGRPTRNSAVLPAPIRRAVTWGRRCRLGERWVAPAGRRARSNPRAGPCPRRERRGLGRRLPSRTRPTSRPGSPKAAEDVGPGRKAFVTKSTRPPADGA